MKSKKKDNNNQKKTNLKEQIKENGMESVKISTKKCKIAMALAGHHSAALRQRPWVRIPLNYRNFFPVGLQLLKLQLRLRRSYLDDRGRSPKKSFSALRASLWSKNKGEARAPRGPSRRSATASSFQYFPCVSLCNCLVTFLPPEQRPMCHHMKRRHQFERLRKL